MLYSKSLEYQRKQQKHAEIAHATVTALHSSNHSIIVVNFVLSA